MWRKMPLSQRKKSPYSELFWSAFLTDFPAFGLNTERYYLSVFSPNAEKSVKNADQNNSEYGLFLGSVCKWHTFWMVPCWDKVTFYEKFSHSHTLEIQIVWKSSSLQCYWWKYWNAEMYLNFKNFQLKWTILKHIFTGPKQWAIFWKLFSPPPD